MSHGSTIRTGRNPLYPSEPAQKKRRVLINRSGANISAEQKIVKERISGVERSLLPPPFEADFVFSELSFVQRDTFFTPAETSPGDHDNTPFDDTPFHTLPPGEEGFLQSHAGGEAIFQKILMDIDLSKRSDLRDRSDRLQKDVNSWRTQLPILVPAYLRWKSQVTTRAETPNEDQPVREWVLQTISVDQRAVRQFHHVQSTLYSNQALVEAGFLGASPDKPTLAFSFSVFELYRQLHRVCPRLSIQGFCKALDHLHHVPVSSHLPTQFSLAYDCYLEILRNVDSIVDDAMNYTKESWFAEHVCPPCLYKLEDEPDSKFSLLAAMDGNVSLKLFSSDVRAGMPLDDDRESRTGGRWLRPAFVDQFRDEVANSKKKPLNLTPSGTAPTVAGPSTSQPSDPQAHKEGDGDQVLFDDFDSKDNTDTINTCVERWRNAGPESRKKMFALFAVSGIFVTVCRHGHVLLICDMIRSGELMKYPIAHVQALMNRYGSDIGLGYDIWCQLIKTLRKSSLAETVKAHNVDGVVPAFHGYAHNRLCQLSWHPLYKDGTGIEDFEECERTFSKSNELAGVTRLATPFHRHQQINEHFHFHDLDKYAAAGTFIYQNYVQALHWIHVDGALLATLEDEFSKKYNYDELLQEEKAYLISLQTEPPEYLQDIEYLERLIKLQDYKIAADEANKERLDLDRKVIYLGLSGNKITTIKARATATFTWWTEFHEKVCAYEEQNNIETRWTPDSVEWVKTSKYMTERKYHLAVDNLERLYVQRMLELTKLGLSGIGYKLREHIGKALKARAEAIRNALTAYNSAAKILDPPREQLTWKRLMEIGGLSEFDLLRDTRHDVRKAVWTNPRIREAMNFHFCVKHAIEERDRLNIEIRRLITYMLDQEHDFRRAYVSKLGSDSSSAAEIKLRWEFATRVNASIAKVIARTSQLTGFTGSLTPGSRVGRNVGIDLTLPPWATPLLGITITNRNSAENSSATIRNTFETLVVIPGNLSALNTVYSCEPPPASVGYGEGQQADVLDETVGDDFVSRDIDVGGESVLDMMAVLSM
ncbi:hypothetical protein BDN72DRAFT_905854 [Pluteus cervinus]|uniref:Uncharacterized protein n=1 Tax=Pluteus cervinus TaxID=181527 RepID=A0ACD3A176_9AGAR|nr:hypothetical protein BDN72DRAFT_905854 [Pluteus cervinus]